MTLGLRIDVCTYEGLRTGVPNLLRLLDRYRVRASFFVALGPDRSGRAILQALRPGFLAKMRRTGATQTYGWRTILSGTLLPARRMADLADTMRAIIGAGHELAAHGYDHRGWQDRLHRMPEQAVRFEMTQAVEVYQRVVGRRPQGFGAPGWQCGPASLRLLDELGFAYASDTRGRGPFYPMVAGRRLRTLQLPTTLPTLDERLGLDGTDGEGFVSLVCRRIEREAWNVLTFHAEMEGRGFQWVAERILTRLAAQGAPPLPLAGLSERIRTEPQGTIPEAEILHRSIRGRAGQVAVPAGLEPAD
jgi:undecaprenyl phosphate-alpha-L-ara4FN deformylase